MNLTNSTVECETDFDCAEGQICYKDVEWSDEPPFCYCSTWYGWSGENCETFGITTYYLVLTGFLFGIIALVFAVVGWHDVVSYLVVLRKESCMTAGSVTLFCTTLCLTCFAIANVLLASAAFFPNLANESSVGSDDKFSLLSVVARPFLFLVSVTTIISSLHVSVMWLELAFRAENMKTAVIVDVTYYRRAVQTVEVLFAITMLLLASVGRFDIVSVAVIPIVLFLALVFAVGRQRMVRVLKTALSLASTKEQDALHSEQAEPGSSTNRQKTQAERTKRTMQHIQRVSLNIIIGMLLIGVTAALYFITSTNIVKAQGWKDFAPVGKMNLGILFNQIWQLSILYTNVAIFLYAHRLARKLIRRKKGHLVSSTGNNSKSTGAGTKDETFVQTLPPSSYYGGNLVGTPSL